MKTLVVNADLRSIRGIAPWLAENVGASLEAEAGAEILPRLELGLQELAVNIVEHGYAGDPGTIEFLFAAGTGAIIIEVVDDAPPVDLASAADDAEPADRPSDSDPSPEARVRGYGLALIQKLTSDFGVHHDGRTNRWRLVFPVRSPLQRTP